MGNSQVMPSPYWLEWHQWEETMGVMVKHTTHMYTHTHTRAHTEFSFYKNCCGFGGMTIQNEWRNPYGTKISLHGWQRLLHNQPWPRDEEAKDVLLGRKVSCSLAGVWGHMNGCVVLRSWGVKDKGASSAQVAQQKGEKDAELGAPGLLGPSYL